MKGPTGLTGLMYTGLFMLVTSGVYLFANLLYNVGVTHPTLSVIYWTGTAIVLVWAIWSIRADLRQREASA